MSGENTGSIGRGKRVDYFNVYKKDLSEPGPGSYFNSSLDPYKNQVRSTGKLRGGGD